MVIKNIVPPENCDAVAQDMFDLLGWDIDDPSSWYTYPGGAMRSGVGSDHESGNGGGTMLNMWQTQSQWNNRQHPRIYKAFCEIWGTDKLWCSIDTADCKPPKNDELPGWGAAGGIHCDVEQRMLRGGLAMEPPGPSGMNAPWGLRVQGNLYIGDTAEDGGGFRAVRGFHKSFNKWIERFPEDANLDFTLLDNYDDPDFPVINIEGNKGDFLLWHSFLPHSNGTNFGTKPRMCQYITMWPHDLSYWPTYRTTGDTREQEPSAMLTDVPPELMTITADDGSRPDVDQETLAKAVHEEERQRRIAMWSERYPGGCCAHRILGRSTPSASHPRACLCRHLAAGGAARREGVAGVPAEQAGGPDAPRAQAAWARPVGIASVPWKRISAALNTQHTRIPPSSTPITRSSHRRKIARFATPPRLS